MARIFGVNIPVNKKIYISLTYVYGIGVTTAKKILAECGIDPITKVKDLNEDQINAINRFIEANVTVEGDLRRIVKGRIKDLIAEGRYRGLCHRIGKPVRGQNWHSNGKTARKRAGKG